MCRGTEGEGINFFFLEQDRGCLGLLFGVNYINEAWCEAGGD